MYRYEEQTESDRYLGIPPLTSNHWVGRTVKERIVERAEERKFARRRNAADKRHARRLGYDAYKLKF